jgi:beta-glucosidase
LTDVVDSKITLDEFMAQLSDDELLHLLGGQPNEGVANTFGIGNLPEYGIPNIMTADGPAGIRINPVTGIRTTAWPCGTMLASTWNPEIVSRVGVAAGKELKENNLGIWLAPALNIHRNPLCGRNFEYYSEDPLVAGKMAAGAVRGAQSQRISASPKHFAANNKEYIRKECDSRVTERALREIYLKAFEFCVKESDPKTIMTSYNPVNGIYASESADLQTHILRGEWGFDGLIMTDWSGHGLHGREVKAGSDIKMPKGHLPSVEAYLWDAGTGGYTLGHLQSTVYRILKVFLWYDGIDL